MRNVLFLMLISSVSTSQPQSKDERWSLLSQELKSKHIPATDKKECKILREVLFKQHRDSDPSQSYYRENDSNPTIEANDERYLNSCMKMYELMKCNRFEDNI